jgi:hypothetical protein
VLAESVQTLNTLFLQDSLRGQVYEYVVPFAEQGIALIVRRTGSGASQNLDGSQFTAQLALDLELSGIDLAAIEKHGWVYSHHRYPPRSSGR